MQAIKDAVHQKNLRIVRDVKFINVLPTTKDFCFDVILSPTKWMIAQDAVLVVFRSVDAMSNLLGMNH